MPMLTKDQLAALETEHKRIAHVVGANGAWEVVFRKPNRAEYKRFRAMANNDAQKAEAQEWLCRVTVVYPARDQFDALLEDWPGIPEAAGKAVGELLGFATDESAKS